VHASTVGADRVLWLVLDITDRKEAEQKLRESEERFRGCRRRPSRRSWSTTAGASWT
jgi:hypothetical protein